MSAHIHAALMLQYAQDAAETDKPWERWESLPSTSTSLDWIGCVANPFWHFGVQYRRKATRLKQVTAMCWYNKRTGVVSWSSSYETDDKIHLPQHDLIVEMPV